MTDSLDQILEKAHWDITGSDGLWLNKSETKTNLLKWRDEAVAKAKIDETKMWQSVAGEKIGHINPESFEHRIKQLEAE